VSLSRLTRRIRHAFKERTGVILPYAQRTSEVAFYATKGPELPRFIYRRLAHALDAALNSGERHAAIESFAKEVQAEGSKGEFIKLTWSLPNFITERLSDDERELLANILLGRRSKRNRKLADIFPICSDEFSLQADFLDSAFDFPATPMITKEIRVFTIGSCFARNIAVYLKSKGYNADSFRLAEDLNSPLSNAKMIAVAAAGRNERAEYLERWISALRPKDVHASVGHLVKKESDRLDQLVDEIRSAEVIVQTIGNTLDFFIEPQASDIAPNVPVAPKFLWISNPEDARGSISAGMKTAGARLRSASFAEAKAAISSAYLGIRKLNPSASCILTLSPVPIDGAIGITRNSVRGAVELDCISKSILRAALFELSEEWLQAGTTIHYFPSYELVRWIGPLLPIPIFGAEDASSKHVSQDVLSAVYSFFISKFCVEPEAAAKARQR